MSSYGVGGIGVAVAIFVGGPLLAAGAAALLVGAAGVAAVGALGAATVSVDQNLARRRLEENERQIRLEAAKAARKNRIDRALKRSNQIKSDCEKLLYEISTQEIYKSIDLAKISEKTVSTLKELIDSDIPYECEPEYIEQKNIDDGKKIAKLSALLKSETQAYLDRMERNSKFYATAEHFDHLFDDFTTVDYSNVEDVQATDHKAMEREQAMKEIEFLSQEFDVAYQTELKRWGDIPIKGQSIDSIGNLLRSIHNELDFISNNMLESEDFWTRVENIKKKIGVYKNYKSIMDYEEERFLKLYLVYEASCKEMQKGFGKQRFSEFEAKEPVEFDSYEELEKEVQHLKGRIERFKLCLEKYKQLGESKEAYVCMALEYEFNKAGYDAADMEYVDEIIGEESQPLTIAGYDSMSFRDEDGNVTQIYDVEDELKVKVVVHNNGSSTIETIVDSDMDDEVAISAQKKNCSELDKIKNSLYQDFFIEVDPEFEKDYRCISRYFSKMSDDEYDESVKRAKDERERRAEAARKAAQERNHGKKANRVQALAFHM